jgi:hypothetical protein
MRRRRRASSPIHLPVACSGPDTGDAHPRRTSSRLPHRHASHCVTAAFVHRCPSERPSSQPPPLTSPKRQGTVHPLDLNDDERRLLTTPNHNPLVTLSSKRPSFPHSTFDVTSARPARRAGLLLQSPAPCCLTFSLLDPESTRMQNDEPIDESSLRTSGWLFKKGGGKRAVGRNA